MRGCTRTVFGNCRFPACDYFHPRLMAEQPEQDEIGVDFAVQHGFQIELDERLPGEADIVTQDAQTPPLETKPHKRSSERFSSSWTMLCGLVRAAPATPAVRRSRSIRQPTRCKGVFCQAWETG
jgi:hypothetical protein